MRQLVCTERVHVSQKRAAASLQMQRMQGQCLLVACIDGAAAWSMDLSSDWSFHVCMVLLCDKYTFFSVSLHVSACLRTARRPSPTQWKTTCEQQIEVAIRTC